MKKTTLYIVCLLLFFTPFSCKKFIQQQEQNAIVNLVTNGTWRITGYTNYQAINLTDSFSGYSFQFYENGTITSTKSNVQTSGTWTADVNARSITSNFPSASFPLNLLNFTWTVTDSYTDSVAARTPVENSYNILNLHKN